MERLVLWHRTLPPTRLENDDPEGVAAWVDQVEAGSLAVGGVVLARAGGFAALAFELTELEDALALALGWLDEAERRTPELPIAVGVATGELQQGPKGATGAALDRAHLLAGRARRGELVVDAATRDLAGGVFLFDRAVGTGAAALRGTTIDRRMPRRAACRVAIAALRPACVPTLLTEELAPVRALASSTESACVLLRGPSGAGSSRFLLTLERDLAPSFVLRLGPVPSALEPLGSLRLALGDSPPSEALSAEPFAALRRGEAVSRATLLDALTHAAGERPWLILDPLAGLDAASLDVVGELITRCPTFLVARAGMDVPLPKALDALPWVEHVVPSLRLDDAKEVARCILGEADEDVVRRVAVLGGDTPLGVVEAARGLLAAGDVIHEDGRFVWRSAPRSGIRAIPLDTLVHERVDALEGPARALLEIASLTPAGTLEPVVLDVARRDGLGDVEASRAQLEREAFLRPGAFAPTSEHLRRAVLQSMPPARRAELERFLAAALDACGPPGPLAGVSRGVSLAEGGDGPGAAQLFLRAARELAATDWRDAARRLAVAAVQTDPRAETRAEATTLARSLGSERPPAEVGERVSQVAVSALLAGDLGTVERTVDAAIAEGRDLAAADRVRAMAYLAKGDPARAMEVFERLARNTAREPRARARSALTLAWIRLHAGNANDAVRAALEALALVRRLKDPRGETAALHSLAACYRALHRDEDAARARRAHTRRGRAPTRRERRACPTRAHATRTRAHATRTSRTLRPPDVRVSRARPTRPPTVAKPAPSTTGDVGGLARRRRSGYGLVTLEGVTMAASKKSPSSPARRSAPAKPSETVDAAPARSRARSAPSDPAPAQPPKTSTKTPTKRSAVKTEAPSRSKSSAKADPTPSAKPERDARVRELAYLLAESNHFAGDPAFYWRIADLLQERA